MSLTINDFINRKILNGVTPEAGRNGFDNEITWFTILEILDTPDSVKEGELVFTTGYQLDDPKKYRHLIKDLLARGCSGLVIQPGYYLESVPSYILKAAEKNDFPVMTIPRNITHSEIISRLSNALLASRGIKWDQQLDSSILRWISSVLEDEGNVFLNVPSRRESGKPGEDFSEELPLLMVLEPVVPVSSEDTRRLVGNVYSFLKSNSAFCTYREFPSDKYVFIMVPASDTNKSMMYNLNIQLTFISEDSNTNLYLGSDKISSKDTCSLTFEHCKESIATLYDCNAKRGLCQYSHRGFLTLLSKMYNDESSTAIPNTALQGLLDYDRNHNTAYTHTLRMFLSNNCNISHTSKQLFIHRHTLLKRLARIHSLTGIDLDDFYFRTHLSISLMYHDYFGL